MDMQQKIFVLFATLGMLPGALLADDDLLKGVIKQGTRASVLATSGADDFAWDMQNATSALSELSLEKNASITTQDNTSALTLKMGNSDPSAFLTVALQNADDEGDLPLYGNETQADGTTILYYTNLILTMPPPVGRGRLPELETLTKMYATAEDRADDPNGATAFTAKLGLAVAMGYDRTGAQKEDCIFLTRRRFIIDTDENEQRIEFCNTGYTVSEFKGAIELCIQFKTLAHATSSLGMTWISRISAYRVLCRTAKIGTTTTAGDWVCLTEDLGYKWATETEGSNGNISFDFDYNLATEEQKGQGYDWFFFLDGNATASLQTFGISTTEGSLYAAQVDNATQTANISTALLEALKTAKSPFYDTLSTAQGVSIYEDWVSMKGSTADSLNDENYDNFLLNMKADSGPQKLTVTHMDLDTAAGIMKLTVSAPDGGNLTKNNGTIAIKRAATLAELAKLSDDALEEVDFTGEGQTIEITVKGVDKPFVQVFLK